MRPLCHFSGHTFDKILYFMIQLNKFVKVKEKNMSVKLMIDSASDISKKEAEALGIIMLPMTITFDGTDLF